MPVGEVGVESYAVTDTSAETVRGWRPHSGLRFGVTVENPYDRQMNSPCQHGKLRAS